MQMHNDAGRICYNAQVSMRSNGLELVSSAQ
jgi:hypothetical protein